MKRILTGIQPSGILHVGNYFGAIRPIVDLQAEGVLLPIRGTGLAVRLGAATAAGVR